MYYLVKIFADTQLKFLYVCLFALCLKREETSHFLVGFGMQLRLELGTNFSVIAAVSRLLFLFIKFILLSNYLTRSMVPSLYCKT
jgi:hypothetical protein